MGPDRPIGRRQKDGPRRRPPQRLQKRPLDNRDREVLRSLASRRMEQASLPVMVTRRRQWTALKDLRGERPMVLFETWPLENYVAEEELRCQDAGLRQVAQEMRAVIRQAEEIGDDYVVEPFLRVWDIDAL